MRARYQFSRAAAQGVGAVVLSSVAAAVTPALASQCERGAREEDQVVREGNNGGGGGAHPRKKDL